MATFSTAVIGLGFMGWTHIEMLRRIGVHVAGILGSTREEEEKTCEKFAIPRRYASFEEACADPEIQTVHLCTPNHLHYPMAKAALQAGKHVICEKPLANTSAEALELARLADEQKLVGAVNYNLRFYPLCQEARARIQAGEIGEVRLLHGEYAQDWLFLPTDWNWRLVPEEGGTLRAVADIGTHWLDMVTWLTGLEVTSLLADLKTFIPVRQKPLKAVETFAGKLAKEAEGEPVEIRTEDYAGILLRFSNGARGSVLLSQINAGRKNHFQWEINGSKASLQWVQENPNELWIGHRDEPNEILIKDPALMHPEARQVAGYPGGHAEGYPDTFAQLFKAVYTYIGCGQPGDPKPFPTFWDGYRESRLCEAVQASAAEERWVDISSL